MTPQVLMNTPPAPFNQTHSTKRTTLDFPGYTTTKYDLSQGTHANDGLLEHARIGYFGSRHRFIGWNDDHEAEDISHHQTETPQNVSAFCWRGPGVMEKSEVSKALLHTILYIYIYIYMHVTITVFTYLFIQEIVYSFINLIKNLSVNVHLFIQLIFICLFHSLVIRSYTEKLEYLEKKTHKKYPFLASIGFYLDPVSLPLTWDCPSQRLVPKWSPNLASWMASWHLVDESISCSSW